MNYKLNECHFQCLVHFDRPLIRLFEILEITWRGEEDNPRKKILGSITRLFTKEKFCGHGAFQELPLGPFNKLYSDEIVVFFQVYRWN